MVKSGETLDRIRRRLAGSQPPAAFSPKRVKSDVPADFLPRPPWKPAAVLLPVVPRPAGASLLFTERTTGLQDHAGQVSFPGGSREPQDRDAADTALREAEEEIGLPRRQVEIAGYLNGYLTVTGYAITPVVGLVEPQFELRPDALEVAEVFEVPLGFLADPRNRQVRSRQVGGRDVGFYLFQYGSHVIWGATAAILVDFLDRLQREPPA